MTSQTTFKGPVNTPVIAVVPPQVRLHTNTNTGNHSTTGPVKATANFFLKNISNFAPDLTMDLKDGFSPERKQFDPSGKPPGPKSKKASTGSIHRSASSDALLSQYMVDCQKPDHQSVIKLDSSKRSNPLSSSPMSILPQVTTKSHLNLYPVGSFFKKRLAIMNRSSFKKLSQGSTEGLNQELEKLALTSEDDQKCQTVPDGHRAPVQELLDMFCDSPPITGSSGASDSGLSTPSHLPLISTLSSSSSSSPPPPIVSVAGDFSDNLHQRHPHSRHLSHQLSHQQQHSWVPFGSPEMLTTFTLGSEVKQVKPLRNSNYRCPPDGCEEISKFVLKEKDTKTKLDSMPSSSTSSSPSSLLLHPPHTLPIPQPLLSPITIRATIPSNESAFASYPTLPKSFKVKDSPRHGSRSSSDSSFAAAAAASTTVAGAGIGNSISAKSGC